MEEEQKGLKIEHSTYVRILVDMQLQKWEDIHGKKSGTISEWLTYIFFLKEIMYIILRWFTYIIQLNK